MFEIRDGLAIALADGAGGTGGGGAAAQAIVDAVGATAPGCDWLTWLAEIDRDVTRLGSGQSTAVILTISSAGISGASVGDSGAWLITGMDILELTGGQVRKPLVGDGCIPSPVTGPRLAGGTLLVASDGLLRYAKPADIARIAGGADLQAAARALVDLVRLPSGALQDDVGIVLCRQRP